MPIRKKPTIIKHSGMIRIQYNNIDRLKFMDAFPFSSIQADSSFRDTQHISGPITPPKGIGKKLANPERWQSIAQFLSDSDKTLFSTLFSSMTLLFIQKT
ncbi:MAG: hypothetical protein NT092_05775 [Bacteroidia bacterium]|nr:hypothetical protein [Bacteroidia bacterium]